MTTKDKKYRPNQFALNRKQVLKLANMAENFSNVEWFTLEERLDSGIGPTIVVRFNLFGDRDKDVDTTVDITDVSTW